MIDPRIPLMGQQQANHLETATQGIQFGQGLRQLLAGRQIGKMQQLENPEDRKAFANNSMFSRELNAQIKADDKAAMAAALEQQKALADIGKVKSEAFKNNTQGQGYGLDNSGKRQAAIENVIQQVAMTGDPTQVKIGLSRLAKTGLITPEQYKSEIAIVEAMRPEDLIKYAQSSALTNKEVAPYLYQTANNAADNAQSDINNQRSTNASIYATDTAASTADKNRAQQQEQFDANLYVQQNKPLDYFTAADGTRYAVYPGGRGIPVSGPTGEPVKVQQSGSSAVKQLEYQEKALSFEEAATSAREAATLARTLADDSEGLSKTAGGWGVMAKIPGTDARSYSQQVETLKSQVFLNQVEKMKGMGALTDAEGARLEKAIASLDINLSKDQLKANLIEIERVLLRAEQNALKRAHIYRSEQQQGVPYANAGQQKPQSTFNLFD